MVVMRKMLTFVLISIEVMQSPGVEARGATNDPVHLISFVQQQLCPVMTVKYQHDDVVLSYKYDPSCPVIPGNASLALLTRRRRKCVAYQR
jgi:hypothetical protein